MIQIALYLEVQASFGHDDNDMTEAQDRHRRRPEWPSTAPKWQAGNVWREQGSRGGLSTQGAGRLLTTLARGADARRKVLLGLNPHRWLFSKSQNQLQSLRNALAHPEMNGGLLLFQLSRAIPQAPLDCHLSMVM